MNNLLIYSFYGEIINDSIISSIQKIESSNIVNNKLKQNLITIYNSTKITVDDNISSNSKKSGILSISLYSKGENTVVITLIKNMQIINSNPEKIKNMIHTLSDINGTPKIKKNKNTNEINSYFLEPNSSSLIKFDNPKLLIDPGDSLSILVHSLSKNPCATTVFIHACIYEY